MQRSAHLLRRTQTGLLIVDMQQKLLPAICGREQLLLNCVRLVEGAAVLGLPVFATEQYRDGLGPTVAELARIIPCFSPVHKVTFSVCGAVGLVESLQKAQIADLLVCGVEAHVCVSQSVLELLELGFGVFVVSDAVSSRTTENHRVGLERMRDAGATIVSTEMALFELLRTAGTPEFKKVLTLVK